MIIGIARAALAVDAAMLVMKMAALKATESILKVSNDCIDCSPVLYITLATGLDLLFQYFLLEFPISDL